MHSKYDHLNGCIIVWPFAMLRILNYQDEIGLGIIDFSEALFLVVGLDIVRAFLLHCDSLKIIFNKRSNVVNDLT